MPRRTELVAHREGVHRARDSQGPSERPATFCQVETLWVGVQPSTPARQAPRNVDHDHGGIRRRIGKRNTHQTNG